MKHNGLDTKMYKILQEPFLLKREYPDAERGIRILLNGYPDALKGHPDAFVFQLQKRRTDAGKLFKIDFNQHHSNKTEEKQVPMN